VKRFVVTGLVCSIALNAALGIYALLAGEFGDLERQILLTSVTVSGVGMLSLACGPARERRLVWPLPPAGSALAVAAGIVYIVAIWLDSPSEALLKTGGTATVVAVVATHGSLLALATLAQRYRWALPGAIGLAIVLGGMITAVIWGEFDNESYGRAVGVVAVLLAAFTLLVPILHRASRGLLSPADARVVAFCPFCGAAIAHGTAEIATCERCDAGFAVRVVRDGSAGSSPKAA
jgi:hypothetical protein